MGIFTGLFKSRDKPKDSYDSPSYSYFFGRPMQANESPTEQPCSILQFMPACVCCQKRLHSCRFMYTNTTIAEKSECHSTRFTFYSTISRILK